LFIDSSGVTLGGAPLRSVATTANLPWSEFVAVVPWRQWYAGIPLYVGALQPGDRPPLLGARVGAIGGVVTVGMGAPARVPDPRLAFGSPGIAGGGSPGRNCPPPFASTRRMSTSSTDGDS
jgi:hypothetical protein